MSLLKIYQWKELSPKEQKICLARAKANPDTNIKQNVSDIIQAVQNQGDSAVLKLTAKFDKVKIPQLKYSPPEHLPPIDSQLIQSLQTAIQNISKFHSQQIPQPFQIETSPGIICHKKYQPLQRVGIYIPGGTAPLLSTLMMLAIPAKIANCPEIVMVTPPSPEGELNPVIQWLAKTLSINEIYLCGGAQAIAALAYGTESLQKVDKIFGPGNTYVTEAKIQVSLDPMGTAIDMPAGPSEVLIIADDTSRPDFVAADLLSQAEHDELSQVILVSPSSQLIHNVNQELQKQLTQLPRRDIATQALSSSRALLTEDISQALHISNLYAPEHLILAQKDAVKIVPQVIHAGSVFIGPWSSESLGDYASGPNHVLPTYGFARSHSGIGVESFMKSTTFQEVTPQGLLQIAQTVECLAEAEGLIAHARSVKLRREKLQGNL
ncbi:MAG: histidinol dehydrogenase [Bdellovibrionales bacterium]|nr:histidinol dehydrogenase [Bdellovibrionales bacterium]